MKNETCLIGKLSLGDRSVSSATTVCFEENETRRIVRLCRYDHLVIHDPSGEVVFEGRSDVDYSTGQTIINALYCGQLIPWPATVKHQGYVFLNGIPKDIPLDVWMSAVLTNDWKVELTPNPPLTDVENKPGTLCVNGILDPFFETGTEGVVWAVDDPRKHGYDGLNYLENGDRLVVFEVDGVTIRWEGKVGLEYKRRWRPYPMNPEYGQQEVLGMWVHGFQRDLDPEVWARMFFDRLPCSFSRVTGSKSGKSTSQGLPS